MLATHTLSLSLSLHSSPTPTTRPCSLSSARPALTDSTNVNSQSNVCGSSYAKSCVFPTSSARTGCGWNDFESPTTSVSTLAQPRHHHSSSVPSPFPVTYKAPPTVSISLSAACSQSIPGERLRGARALCSEPDLPDVTSVVPFPTTPLDGDMDVIMLDGTFVPCSDSQLPKTPRKRHSAQSSVSSSPGSVGKDVKQKRQRKSKRQVAELWWLGVVHRSILRGIEARESNGELDASDRLSSGPRNLDAMDRVLVEKIQRRLAENGCVEGRALPNPLPRISSPSISVPSLNLVALSRKTLTLSTGSTPLTLQSELNPNGSDVLDEIATVPSAPKPIPLSIMSHSRSPAPSSASTSHRRHVRFETPQGPRQAPLHPSIPRRSPSPPPRTGIVSTNAQTLTLTMPQLVASLTLACHERSGLRLRGRTPYRVTEGGKNAGRSMSSVPCSGGDAALHSPLVLARARLSCAPERKSPLSRVLYVES